MRSIIESMNSIPGALPLSYSRMQCLFNCPRQFYLRYCTHDPRTYGPRIDASQPDTSAGSLMHDVMCDCMRMCWNSISDHVLQKLPIGGFEKAYRNIVVTDLLPKVISDRTELVYNTAKETFYKVWDLVSDHPWYIGAEDSIKLDRMWRFTDPRRRDYKNLGFTGVIDLIARLPDKTMIFDYKTEPYTEGKFQTTVDQLKVYAYMELARNISVKEVHISAAFLTDANIVEGSVLTRDNYPELAEWFRDMVLDYRRAFQNPMEATAGKHCQWCRYKDDCPKEINSGSTEA